MTKTIKTSVLWFGILTVACTSVYLGAQAPATTGSALVFSTYLGGKQLKPTFGVAIAVDKKGYVLVTGRTQAEDFPTISPAQKKYGGGGTAGSETKPGGTGGEAGTGIAVDRTGTAYVTGYSDSPDFPIKVRLPGFGGGAILFVVRIDPAGKELLASTISGTTSGPTAIALDGSGFVYVAASVLVAPNSMPRPNVTRFDADLTTKIYSKTLSGSFGDSVTDTTSIVSGTPLSSAPRDRKTSPWQSRYKRNLQKPSSLILMHL